MADQETVDLAVLGPFGGLDVQTASIYADAKTSTVCTNVSTHHLEGAMATALGRGFFQQFPDLEGTLAIVTTFIQNQNKIYYICQDNLGNVAYYDAHNAVFGTLGNWPTFTEAIQSNGILWLNNGYQIFPQANDRLQVARWQYPQPNDERYSYSATLGTPGQPPLAAALYSYAFVQKIALPNIDTTAYQYTTPTGAIATGTRKDGANIFPFQVDNHGNAPDNLNGVFSGLTDDGYLFTTDVYRYSTNTPTWFFLTNLSTNGVYVDSASDASIIGNQTLILNQDPPATGFNNGVNPIEAHQDRMWTVAIVNNANTNNLPQTQVWYSRVGEPWSFDQVNAILLTEDEETTLELRPQIGITGVPYGDFPTGLCALGSSLMVFRRQTTSIVYGVDESTYQSLKVFADLGMTAPLSLVKAYGLVWWLSAQGGFWSFDGSSVQWISKPILNLLNSLGPAALQTAVGAYKDLTVFWSFPITSAAWPNGLTVRFYIPTQKWSVLPYSTPSFAYSTGLPSDLTAAPLSMNQMVAVRPNSSIIDFWQATYDDLAEPVTGIYRGQETDAGAMQTEKNYTKVSIMAPNQPGVKVSFDLIVNGAVVQTWPSPGDPDTGTPVGQPIDLGASSQPTRSFAVTAANCVGYTATLNIRLTNVAGATAQAVIYGAKVGGTPKRSWIIQNQ